ncbi:MAG: efflux RND transporter permease subunit [Deltaproteobacteria bacterium]|nr:efflux RND transporter permease subunit [Deltaproteobacteria bacterium]
MKLADISIRRPVLASVMVGVLAVFGLWAYPRIGVDLFPDVEFPVVVITAIYPGADPATMESKVIHKLEEEVSTINGIKLLRSTSMENVGMVIIQFELERRADLAVQDVRDKVAGALQLLPPDLEPPVVQRFDVNAAPIMALAVSGKLSPREITKVADDQIKRRLQTISGVGGVEILGGQEREFHVWIDPQRLESYGLAAGDVLQALAAQNVEIPGGRLDVGSRELTVKTLGQVHSAAELSQIIITAAMGTPVRIGDVAGVEDGEEERRSHSSVNGTAAVGLVVRKQSGANTVEVAAAVRKALTAITPLLPPGVEVSIPTDNSTFISNTINDVQFDLLYGAILAVLIIFLFLYDWRATLISALALPVSVIATFAFIKAMGFTFNMMTMLALSLSIGILIDDAIVVIENIHRHLRSGKPPMKAAADATAEIGLAVMATTASILAVFVPVATMQGMVGRFFKQFGLTVAFAVSVSLFVAFTLTPMMSARLLTVEAHKGRLGHWVDARLATVDRFYRQALSWALAHRGLTVLIATVMFVSSLGLGAVVPKEFMVAEDRSQFLVKLELPAGTGLASTEHYAEGAAEELRAIPGVLSTFVTVGGGSQNEVNRADIQVNTVGRRERTYTQLEAMGYARGLFVNRPNVTVAVEPVNAMGGGGGFRAATVQYVILGDDYDALNRVAQSLIQHLRGLGGYVDLDTTFRGGKPELAVSIDRDRAADLGVPVASIAMTLRSLIAGDKATELTTGGDRFDVRVQLQDSFMQRPEDILGLKVRSTSGPLVHLANVIAVSPGAGPAKIERQDRQRQVTVFANLSGKALGTAITEIDDWAAQNLPADLTSKWSGMGDIMTDSFKNLFASLILAVIMVFLILAAQFESVLYPLTIMLSLPLSLVGAMGGLAATRAPLGIMAMIGVILLMGLVTKNAILLVDYTNALREKGMGTVEALLAAGPVRLRPILMTTAAMIFGMVPVALGLSEGGETRAPMAVAVIGGLLTSTLLTLLVVPVAYAISDSMVVALRRRPRQTTI